MARVCVDSTYFDITPTGELTLKTEQIGLRQILVFDSPGTSSFLKASFPGLKRVHVRVVGGGGGGGGSVGVVGGSTVSSGGGGGGYSESLIDASTLAPSVTVTVGAGGAGGLGQNPGQAGNPSSFGGLVVANAGGGSQAAASNIAVGAATVSGGYGAPVGVGQITTTGGNSDASCAPNGNAATGGNGGTAGGGMGQGGAGQGSASNGLDGSQYGGGGSGVATTSNPATRNGGNGASGVVIIALYF